MHLQTIGKAPQHEADLFTNIKGLLTNMSWMPIKNLQHSSYPKLGSILVEAHDKLGHQGVTHIMSHQMTILLEGNEQGYLQIYS